MTDIESTGSYCWSKMLHGQHELHNAQQLLKNLNSLVAGGTGTLATAGKLVFSGNPAER
jgi:hypothetical protein